MSLLKRHNYRMDMIWQLTDKTLKMRENDIR